MNGLDSLTLAIAIAAAEGDWNTVEGLVKLAPDPNALRQMIETVSRRPADGSASMADHTIPPPRAGPVAKPVLIKTRAKPDLSETALAGKDGVELAKLIADSKNYGVRIMSELVTGALKRYKGVGPLLNRTEEQRLATSLAAVNATAELLGRSRVQELAEDARAGLASNQQTGSFKKFADAPAGIIATPEAALDYFLSLNPELGIDPRRFGPLMRRQAFTLAASTNQILTRNVHKIVAQSLRTSKGDADTAKAISDALAAAGVSPRNPQYAEMVYRTNAMDAFQQGFYEQGADPENADTFPVWQYLGIRDGRQGKDHEPHFDLYYPRTAKFTDVRGPRIWNCRCNMNWVNRYDWERLQQGGAAVEPGWD